MNNSFQLGFSSILSPDELVSRALAGESAIELQPEERRALEKLQFRRGHRNPIARRDLERFLSKSEREVKDIVSRLVLTHELPIGSTRSEPHGYFLIITEEDRAAACGPLEAQILAELKRLKVLRGVTTNDELLRQLQLSLEGPSR